MARSSSDPLVLVESGNAAELVMRNSHLQNGSGCAHLYPSSATIEFTNVSFADCEEQGVWAQQVPVEFNGLTFGAGMDWGMELTGVSGTVNGVNATQYDGEGAIVALNSQPSGFTLTDVAGRVTGQAGVAGRTTSTSPWSVSTLKEHLGLMLTARRERSRTSRASR